MNKGDLIRTVQQINLENLKKSGNWNGEFLKYELRELEEVVYYKNRKKIKEGICIRSEKDNVISSKEFDNFEEAQKALRECQGGCSDYVPGHGMGYYIVTEYVVVEIFCDEDGEFISEETLESAPFAPFKEDEDEDED